MFSERSHLRREFGDDGPRFFAWFAGVVAGVYVLQAVLLIWFHNDALLRLSVLSGNNLRAGRFWTPLTYALFHHSPLHLLLNLGGAYILLRNLEDQVSRAHLFALSVATALGGAALWLAFHFGHYGNVLGASSIIMGYLTVYVCLGPREPLWPIPWPRYWLLLALGGFDVLGLLTRELPLGLENYPVSHSAHVGGVVAGWLYHRLVLTETRLRLPAFLRRASAVEPPAWQSKANAWRGAAYTVNLDPAPGQSTAPGNRAPSAASSATTPAPSSFTGSPEELRAEVDRILDKINLHGFGALTEAEKRVLDEARQQLSHR